VLGLLLRWLAPVAETWLAHRFEFELGPYLPLVGCFLLLAAPVMVGVVVGFLMLDERDEGALTALLVTPLTVGQYLLYRIGMPLLASTAMGLLIFPMVNFGAVPWGPVVPVVVVAALEAPLFALFLASFAENKVQGFALAKGLGVLLLAPAAIFFLEVPWQYLAGIAPTYWPVKAFAVASTGEPGYAVFIAAGLASHALCILLLLRRFRRVLHR
jgi:fluoroquinolone transport system permease protein